MSIMLSTFKRIDYNTQRIEKKINNHCITEHCRHVALNVEEKETVNHTWEESV